MHQAAPGTSKPEPSIKINSSPMRNVEDFSFLGSCLSSSGSLDKEISCRLALQVVVWVTLDKSEAWVQHHKENKGHCLQSHDSVITPLQQQNMDLNSITKKTNATVNRAMILTSLLYISKTLTCYHHHIKKLDHFHFRCLPRPLDTCW